MRLLNTRSLELEYFPQSSSDLPVTYAILSHTWGNDEVTFADIGAQPSNNPLPSTEPAKCPTWHIHRHPERHPSTPDLSLSQPRAWHGKTGAAKVLTSAAQALREGYPYIWIDTCCIDKSSSAELSEAINSMFGWYRDAKKCLVYLSDIDAAPLRGDETPDEEQTHELLVQSRWFTRGWTLQELIAP